MNREAILKAEQSPGHDINVEGIPAELISRDRWLCWRWVRGTNGKWTKVPVQPNGRNASTTDAHTWSSFSTVVDAMGDDLGIGFVFNGDGITGIDLDDCRDPETGALQPWAADIVRRLNTYTEISPSQTGVKIFVRGALPERFDKKYQAPGCGEVEIYRDGRFFTVTGQRQPGTPDDVQDRPAELLTVYNLCVGWKQRTPATPPASQTIKTRDRETALLALSVLDPGCHYEQWVRIGMALRAVDPGLLNDWDCWSRGSDKYREGECASKWDSFNGDGVGIATICRLADETGKTWRPTRERQRQPVDYAEVVEEMKPRRLTFRPAGELIQEFGGRLRSPIIEGLLRVGETMNVIAAPKVGKSWLTLSLALCVATGRPWLEQFQTLQRDVLLLDNELHLETLADRIPRVAMALGIDQSEYANRLTVESLRGNLVNLPALCLELQDCDPGRFGLIVVDAFYRTLPGGIDENSNADVAALYNALDVTAKKINCAFVLVHHTSKGDQSGKSVTDIGAGAGSQSRATDTHLTLRQHEVDNVASVAASVRSWPPLNPFCIQWEYPAWKPANQLDPADLRTPKAKASGPSREELRLQADEERLAKVKEAYAAYPDGETSRALRAKAHLSGQKFGELNDRLIAEGSVVEFTAKKGRQTVTMYKMIQAGQVG